MEQLAEKNRNRGPAKIKLRVAVVKPKSSYTRVEVSVAAHFQILESRNLTDILKITAPSVNGKKKQKVEEYLTGGTAGTGTAATSIRIWAYRNWHTEVTGMDEDDMTWTAPWASEAPKASPSEGAAIQQVKYAVVFFRPFVRVTRRNFWVTSGFFHRFSLKPKRSKPGLFFQRFSSALRAKMRRKIEFNEKFLEFSEKSL